MTPLFWLKLMQEVFGVGERLAAKLWKCLDVTPVLLYQIGLCDTYDVDRHGWVARVRRLSQLLPPDALMAASLAAAPETGRVRQKDARDFEEALLQALDRHGKWRWE
jgi:hypothetical protein